MHRLLRPPLAHLLLVVLASGGCSESGSGGAPADSAASQRIDGAAARRPNVIFITVDTLRADRLGFLGSRTTRTPNLDAIAERSVIFERARAAFPKTNPALSSMMTGRYPSAHGVRRNGAVLPEAELTLAEILRAAGYGTYAFISNHVMVSRYGLAQGFTLYDANLPDPIPTRQSRERIAAHHTDAVLSWASTSPPASPFFLWVHYIDPHGPYTPPGFHAGSSASAVPGPILPVSPTNSAVGAIPAYQALPGVTSADEYLARYDAEVDYLDREAGRLVDGLRVRGLFEGALVVFTADHGESLGDHDLWFQHGSSVHEPQIHIPLTILGPGIAARSVDAPVSAVDLMPTILEHLGLPLPGGLQGASLGPWLRGETPARAADRILFAEMGRKRAAMRGTVKLIWDDEKKSVALYDLASDPAEQVDLASSRLEEGRRLMGAVLAYNRQNTRDEAADEDEETKLILRSLGYIE